MRHLIVVLALCLFPATACLAQQDATDQPATKADIERYFEIIQVRERTHAMLDLVSKQMRQMIHDEIQKNPNLPPNAEANEDNSFESMLKNAPVDEMLDAMEPVYAKHFTKGDIDAMVAFYSTPTGKKVIAELPAIAAEGMQASSGILREWMDKTTQQIDGQIADMAKNNQPQSKKPTATN
ncbi:MAG: DUF2059 domain-containing protein [Candidatus Acidiferrales bacterium]